MYALTCQRDLLLAFFYSLHQSLSIITLQLRARVITFHIKSHFFIAKLVRCSPTHLILYNLPVRQIKLLFIHL